MKSTQSILQTILFCMLTFGCVTSNKITKNAELNAQTIDPDMAEAVFRYQFENNASGLQANAAAYFLEIGDSDPDDAFMKRFQGHQPPVRKRSQCSTEGMQVIDKKTGERGLIFRIKKIVVTGLDTAEASGGYYEAGLSASGNTYYLKRKNGEWVVDRDTMHWISQKSPNKSVEDIGA